MSTILPPEPPKLRWVKNTIKQSKKEYIKSSNDLGDLLNNGVVTEAHSDDDYKEIIFYCIEEILGLERRLREMQLRVTAWENEVERRRRKGKWGGSWSTLGGGSR